MKKIIMMVSVLAAVLLVVPIRVDAAEYEDSYNVPAYGNIEVEWDYADEDDRADGVKTWRFYLTANRDMNYIYVELLPTNVEITSVAAGSDFALANRTNTTNGMNVFLEAVGGVNNGDRVLLFTVITKDLEGAEENCELNLSFNNLDCTVSIPGYYFDDNGNSITQEEYAEVCGNTTPTDPEDPNDIPNSETGSVVPYVAIGGGILAIVIVYLFSRKSNKVYKI